MREQREYLKPGLYWYKSTYDGSIRPCEVEEGNYVAMIGYNQRRILRNDLTIHAEYSRQDIGVILEPITR
jgi:hypothetical protein